MSRFAGKFSGMFCRFAAAVACSLLLASAAYSAAPTQGETLPAPSTFSEAAGAAASTSAPASAPVMRVVAGVYRGTFGSATIEMTLTQDKDAEDSVHGWYVVLGSANPQRVQLAGEWEDDTLSMEESRNGVDVSGNWSAIFNDDGFAGQWSDINGEHATDIALHRVKSTNTTKKS